jgi:hypothetical protein
MIQATLNQAVPLQVLAADGRTDLYAQIRVYTAGGLPLATLNCTHVAEGLYSVSWTPSVEGFYTMVAQLYFDAGHTIDAGYERQGDQIDVNSVRTNILRLLGLQHDNAVIDSQIYDVNGNLTSCRVRIYDTKPNALAATLTGLQFQYSVTASYSGGQLSNYTMVRDS